MTKIEELARAAVEVNEVLRHFSKDMLEKIPISLKNYLLDIEDWDYEFIYDESKKLEEQNLSKTAIGIIGLIYKDYICTQKEKTDYEKELNNFMIEQENLKREKYSSQNLFKEAQEKIDKKVNENKQLVVYNKKSLLSKILEKIKKFLK